MVCDDDEVMSLVISLMPSTSFQLFLGIYVLLMLLLVKACLKGYNG